MTALIFRPTMTALSGADQWCSVRAISALSGLSIADTENDLRNLASGRHGEQVSKISSGGIDLWAAKCCTASQSHPDNPVILMCGSTVRAHSSMGGYPISYLTRDGETLSAQGVDATIEACTDPEDPSFVVACAPNYEDESMICAETNEPIECAYPADPAD